MATSPNPFDQFDDQPLNAPPGPVPKGGERSLVSKVAYTPAESADVAAQEDRLKESNINSILSEIKALKPGDTKQRAILENELLAATQGGGGSNPFDQFDDAALKPAKPKGITPTTGVTGPWDAKELMLRGKKETLLNSQDNLAHVEDLFRNQSLPGHLYNAWEKGVFTKTLGELVKSVPEKVKDFSLPELWHEATKDPEQFVGSLLDLFVADPEMALAPVGLGGRIATIGGKLGSAAGKAGEITGRVAGRATEGAVAGAGMLTPISIAEQLDKSGYVDPRQVMEDMKMGAAMGAVMTGAIHLGADIAHVQGNQIYAKVKEIVAGAKPETPGSAGGEAPAGPITALEKAFKEFGIAPEKADAIIAEVNEHARFEQANAMYSEQVKKGLNPEPPVRQDVATRQKEVAFLLKSKEAFEAQAPAAEAARNLPVADRLTQEADAILGRSKALLAEADRLTEQFDRGEVLGAKAALAKDAADRTEADWVALRAQAKMQEAKASDGGTVAVPELASDTHLGQQIVGKELPNVVKAKAALELPALLRNVDDLAVIEAENMKTKGPYAPLTQFWPMVGVGTVSAGLGYMFDPNWERDLALGAGAVLAVKAKGGMWHPEAVKRLSDPLVDRIIRPERPGDLADRLRDAGINTVKDLPEKQWADRAVRNYLNKHAGTESDPLKDVEIPFGTGTQSWGTMMDILVRSRPAKEFGPEGRYQVMADLARTHPNEPIWDMDRALPNVVSYVKDYLSHVGDYLREFVPADKLKNYDLVRAVKETAAQDIKQAKKMADARASGAGTTVFKEYPDGMKWVEVGKGSTKDVNEAALKNEGDVMGHCVGGYCEAVHEGSSKIFSLRDKKGESHVTIEVTPNTPDPETFFNNQTERYKAQHPKPVMTQRMREELAQAGGRDAQRTVMSEQQGRMKVWRAQIEATPEYMHEQKITPDSIQQIKGKQNRAPVAQYLPYVQDFVKSGKWGEVWDIQNTGLTRGQDVFKFPDFRRAAEVAGIKFEDNKFYTKAEIDKALAGNDVAENLYASRNSPLYRTDVPRGERGSIDPEFGRYIALAAAGGLVGSYLADDKATGTLLGAALAAGGLAAIRAATRVVDKAGEVLIKLATGPRDTRFRIDGMINDFQEGVARGGISAMRAVEAFKQLVPEVTRRNELTHFIQTGGDKGPRTAAEQEYVRMQVQGYKGILETEKKAGVIESGIEDGTYIAQYWQGSKDDILKAQRIFSAMSQKNPNAMQRVIPDYATGIKAGLVPKTLDSAEIFGIRMRSSATVIERQKFMQRLKDGRTPTNEKLIVPVNDARGASGYEQINHPSLLAYKVHPDIAPSLRTLYSALTPNSILDALNLVSSASKRAIFSMSMFHPMSLTMALLARPKSLFKLREAHNAWMNGSNDQLLHEAVAVGGVKVEPKRGFDVEYDLLQRAMGRMIDSSAGLFSKGRAALAVAGAAAGFYASDYEPGGALAGAALAFGGGRKGLQAAKVIDEKMQQFLWGYLHPVYKIAAFAAQHESAMKENAARVTRGEAGKPPAQIAREVGGSVNDFFGGQNWAKNGEAVQNKFGRNLALALAQPDSQRLMQIMFQAPDWLVSTYKSIAKALPGVAEKDVAKVHRAYVINSMLMYATLGDALNVYFSGHHFWENKDWTRIDLGDGRTMQTNKHFMEFFHWLADPGQVFYNKLAFWPSEVAEQVENRKWLTSGQKAPAPLIRKPEDSGLKQTGDTLGHVAKRFWPISGSQDSPEKTIAGFFGMPIYGETNTAREERMTRQKEQRATPEARELRRLKREAKREKENR